MQEKLLRKDENVSMIFDRYVNKLENNVYGSLKGRIRLHLLVEDLKDFCPPFWEQSLSILDIGGGSGHFSRICLENGHRVLFCETSGEMLKKAEAGQLKQGCRKRLQFLKQDFLDPSCCFPRKFDLVLMHGSAEWMLDPDLAIEKACGCVKKGGFLSLLVFNRDKFILKKGINGHLLGKGTPPKKKKLVPPGARSSGEITGLIRRQKGRILLQSGIRIFHGFFRNIDQENICREHWLAQEKNYYRMSPFSSLGEHTHFIWKAM